MYTVVKSLLREVTPLVRLTVTILENSTREWDQWCSCFLVANSCMIWSELILTNSLCICITYTRYFKKLVVKTVLVISIGRRLQRLSKEIIHKGGSIRYHTMLHISLRPLSNLISVFNFFESFTLILAAFSLINASCDNSVW